MAKQSRALATLWLTRGEAKDVIAWVERENIPADTSRARALVGKLEQCIAESDFITATEITDDLHRELFKLRAKEAKPFVLAGREHRAKFDLGRKTHNNARHLKHAKEWKRWNEAAAPHWKPGISNNAVARIVKAKLGLRGVRRRELPDD